MKIHYAFILLSLFFITTEHCNASAVPEYKFTLAISAKACDILGDKLDIIKAWMREQEYKVLTGVDARIIMPAMIIPNLAVNRNPAHDSLFLDFYLTDVMIEKRSDTTSSIIFEIMERGTGHPYLISTAESAFDTELKSRLLNLFTIRAHKIAIWDGLSGPAGSPPPDPHNTDSLVLFAIGFQNSGNWDQAMNLYQKAYSTDNRNAAAAYGMALCYRKKNDLTQYNIFLQMALRLDPAKEAFVVELGNYYLDTHQPALAIAQYQKVLPSQKYNDLARWNLYIANNAIGRKYVAVDYLKGVPVYSIYYNAAVNAMIKFELRAEKIHRYTEYTLWSVFIVLLVFLLGRLFLSKKPIKENKWETASAILSFLLAVSNAFFTGVSNFIGQYFI